jgi:anti-sigma regulatory factor (Ser/Thr protein kinase)
LIPIKIPTKLWRVFDEGRIMAKKVFILKMLLEEKTLKIARSFAINVIEYAGLRKEETVFIEMALNEVCENIIKHGYENKKGDIVLKVEVCEKEVSVIIVDWGRSHDLVKYQPIAMKKLLEDGEKGKLGIRLIQTICDSIQYKRLKGKNKTTLIKKRLCATA